MAQTNISLQRIDSVSAKDLPPELIVFINTLVDVFNQNMTLLEQAINTTTT